MSIGNLIESGKVIFDGAMGTYLASKDERFTSRCEIANVEAPEIVEEIHLEYINAGAQVITANTYAANRFNYSEKEAEELLRAGWEIAGKTAGKAGVSAFASIGPVIAENAAKTSEYKWIADILIEAGARDFIFETQSSTGAVIECASYIKNKVPDAYVAAAFSINDSGFTAEGNFAGDLLTATEKCEAIDACGFNCGCSASYMQKTVARLKDFKKPLIVMPNAGYMYVISRKTVYKGSPQLFADKTAQMAQMGAAIIGGCCGTTPEHIRLLIDKLESDLSHEPAQPDRGVTACAGEDIHASRFFEKLRAGEKPIAVELDPPADADTAKFIKGVEELKDAGADIITIADCPIGRARMDSSLLACKVRREFGMEALPHMTCRDRNLNAIQALILGLYAEGVRNLLIVTGDPVPSAEKDAIKSVYQFNSRKLAAFASSLRDRMLDESMHFFGALNVNARNFDIQIKLAKEKIENGISGFLTQPVLTPAAFDNIRKAREELDCYILGGIIPVVSEKNARFMDSEINGINVDPKVTEMYVGKDREEAEELAVNISAEIASRIAPYVDGYYLMTPFQRTSLMRKIIERL